MNSPIIGTDTLERVAINIAIVTNVRITSLCLKLGNHNDSNNEL